MEGFGFVTPVTGLNRPNTGKEDDDDDEEEEIYKKKQYISEFAIHETSSLHEEIRTLICISVCCLLKNIPYSTGGLTDVGIHRPFRRDC
jgi:hypothetical protein